MVVFTPEHDGKKPLAPTTLPALAWQMYLKQLQEKPLRTKALTSAAIASLSDIIAQTLILRSSYNWKRTACMALLGGLWNGPSTHFWQKLMERLFPGKSDPATVLRKTCIDQLTFGPLCTIVFMGYTSLVLDGRGWAGTKQRLAADYWGNQRNGWRLWPVASLLSYQFVPLQFRVLFLNSVSLFWSTFLLWKMRSRGPAAAQLLLKAR